MIVRKSPAEIERMARAGAVVARALEAVTAAVAPGVSTLVLDRVAEDVITRAGATPSFKGYRGFPATLCTSRNQEVVHGIPSAQVVLAEGDLISVDCGAIVEGFHGDSAVTLVVGGDEAAPPEVRTLVRDTREALWAGLLEARDGRRLGDLGAAIEQVATRSGYGIVHGYVGHGIGRSLHEDPAVPNRGTPGHGPGMGVGWVLAVEPMFTLGDARTRVLDDGWTVISSQGSLSAHWEHTVAITPEGPRVLTARSDEPVWPLAEGLPSW